MAARVVAQLRTGDAVRIRGEQWIVVRHAVYGNVSALDVRGAEAANAGNMARFLLPFETVERNDVDRTPRVVRPTEWRVLARAELEAATPRVDSLRSAARASFDVLPYQLEPALAVTNGLGCRLLIADDVGLGKTVQAGLIIAELLERTSDGRALVVCPAGLRTQWQYELAHRFALSAVLLDSSGIARLAASLDAEANPWAAVPLVIASSDFIKRPEVMRALEGLIWDVVVMDEAHNLATRSDRSTAAAALASRARTLVMLSATPHSGDEVAFSRLCGLGDPSNRFPLLLFRRTRDDAGMPVRRRTRWLHVEPTRAESEMYAALIRYSRRVWLESTAVAPRLAISVLLRRAASSAASLARSVERRLASMQEDASGGQLVLPFAVADNDEEPVGTLGAPGLQNTQEERRHLEHVLALARLAATHESKVGVLRRWVSRVVEPTLIFTEYRDTLSHLARALAGGPRPRRIAELHGGLTRSEREHAMRLFTTGGADVLLATDAASEGLNLHHRCRCVINLEVPWSHVRLEQRIGRVDRIGQRRCVHAVNLVARSTLEANGLRRLLERSARAAAALRCSEPTEMDVADAILTGVEASDLCRTAHVPATLRRPDLSSAAAEEAARIRTARAMRSGTLPTQRPFVTRHRRPAATSSLWVFEAMVVDADGMPVWQTLIGFEVDRHEPGLSPADLRAAVSNTLARLNGPAGKASRQLLDAGHGVIRTHAALATAREQAIAAGVRLRHARIAADLLQPGLFDRRTERRAASQSLVLEEALGRCNARLDALGRLATIDVEPPALRFARLIP